ncbi:histamine H2 receptor-like [Montipora capricornis]|uniref:histamine H2 receptor-like n=1 Tax=Montipora capricornis TaxID=246305 RepID=UPI0035F1718D
MSNNTTLLGNRFRTCFFLDVISFGSTDKSLYVSTVMTSLVNAMFSILAITGNSMIIFVLFRTSALRTCSNLFLGNLVVTDLLVGMKVQPLFVLYKIGETLGKHSCYVHVLFATGAWLCSGMSFLTLTALNCERGIAISSPFKYKTLVSSRRVVYISLLVWLFGLLLVSSRFYGLNNTYFYAVCCITIFMSLATFFVVSIGIHRVVQRHRRQIAHTQPVQLLRVAKEARHARNVAWLTSAFFVCYLPTLAVMIAYTIVGYTVDLKTIYLWSDTLVFLNSSINPGIYCWRNRGFREAVSKLLRSKGFTSSSLRKSSKVGNENFKHPLCFLCGCRMSGGLNENSHIRTS